MAETGINRKIAAILSAVGVACSRLMQDDEAATAETLHDYRASIGRVIERHDGSIVNAPGDNILAEFASAVEAVQAACEIQQVLQGRNLEHAPDRRTGPFSRVVRRQVQSRTASACPMLASN